MAALRDEVVELEAEQESLYHGCDTVRCSCCLRRQSIVLSAGQSLMSLPFRCAPPDLETPIQPGLPGGG